MRTRSEVLQVRVSADELERWRGEAALSKLSLSAWVRMAVNSRAKLEAALREEDRREAEEVRRRRFAAMQLPEYEHTPESLAELAAYLAVLLGSSCRN